MSESEAAPRRLLLIVDDDEEARLSYLRGLRMKFEVVVASGAKEALELATKRRFDAIPILQRMTDDDVANFAVLRP